MTELKFEPSFPTSPGFLHLSTIDILGTVTALNLASAQRHPCLRCPLIFNLSHSS